MAKTFRIELPLTVRDGKRTGHGELHIAVEARNGSAAVRSLEQALHRVLFASGLKIVPIEYTVDSPEVNPELHVAHVGMSLPFSVAELKSALGGTPRATDHTRGVWLEVDGRRYPLTWVSVTGDAVVLRTTKGPVPEPGT